MITIVQPVNATDQQVMQPDGSNPYCIIKNYRNLNPTLNYLVRLSTDGINFTQGQWVTGQTGVDVTCAPGQPVQTLWLGFTR